MAGIQAPEDVPASFLESAGSQVPQTLLGSEDGGHAQWLAWLGGWGGSMAGGSEHVRL